jgi:hypothetical protein
LTTQVALVGTRETALDIQNTILAGGSVSSTYSAALTVTAPGVPEPGTVSMFLLAGVGLIGIGRKKFTKR